MCCVSHAAKARRPLAPCCSCATCATPWRCTSRACRCQSSIWATSISARVASRWRPRSFSAATSWLRWNGWRRKARKSKCAQCRASPPFRSPRSSSVSGYRRVHAAALRPGCAGGARGRRGVRRAKGRDAAHAQPADRARASDGLVARRCRGWADAGRAARAALPRRRQSGRKPARQRDAARRRADLDGDPCRNGGRNGRRRATRGARPDAALPFGALRPASGARLGGAQPAASRRGARARSPRRCGRGARQLARAALAVRGRRGDLCTGRSRLAASCLGAEHLRARDTLGPRGVVARHLGRGGGERHARHPRRARRRHRGSLRRGDHRPHRDGARASLMEATAAARAVRRVSTGTLARAFFRSLFLQAAWNPRGMQNVGFADAIAPALEELYPDPAERAKAAARHLEFFNCHPYLAAAILGGAIRLEERVAAGEAPPESVSRFKTTLGPPFAALGDGFFWLALRPVAALAAAVTEPFLGLGCVLVFLGLYNAVHLAARLWLFTVGYLRGEGIVDSIGRAHVASSTPLLKAAGAVLAGALAARSLLAAGLPQRPFHALLVASTIVGAVALLPRLGVTRAVYAALILGLALGARFF